MDFSQLSLVDWASIDPGAISHCLVIPAQNSHNVTSPNGSRVHSTHDCKLAIPKLLEKVAHVVLGLASHLLVSVVKLCNAECEVVFTKTDCTVKYCGRVVLTGYKCQQTGLYG